MSEDAFLSTLNDVIETLEDEGLDYVVVGGLAATAFGVRHEAGDLDVLMDQQDSERVQKLLVERGFELEDTDLDWLRKVRRSGMLVDLIHEIQDKVRIDRDMIDRAAVRDVMGVRARVVPPEDFVVMEAASHSEDTPHYWSNGLATLVSTEIDWPYLLERAKLSPRRVLAMLIYAQSDDLAVPNEVIERLYRTIYDGGRML